MLVMTLSSQPSALLQIVHGRRHASVREPAIEQVSLSKVIEGLAELRILANGGNRFAYFMLLSVANAAIAELQTCGANQPGLQDLAIKQSLTWPVHFPIRKKDIRDIKRQLMESGLGALASAKGADVDNFYDVIAEVLLSRIWLERGWPLPSTEKLPDGVLLSLACKKLPLLRVPLSVNCWWDLGHQMLKPVVDELVDTDFPAIVSLRKSGRAVNSSLIDNVHQAFKARFLIWRRREENLGPPL